ncbi:MAG: exodeoxyribonuclease VII large subunit [Eubacterium sp.]|nr:exodeoxyribonuclease VII large subunit [Eubacterium sp.]
MNVITVSQVNRYIKALLDESAPLRNIYISGEISNFKHYYASGHMYFTLKDENSQLKAVMFSSNASRLKFMPDSGMKVICSGRISVYEKSGEYQLYVDDMQPDGVGALNLAFEQLKEKLFNEGVCSDEIKKPLPLFPKKIGVATSDIGAAVEDIKNITARRYPLAEIVIAPTIVQGASASADIVKSIKLLDSIQDVDVIIVGRGGGSIEDLWAFNTEEVARAVIACKTPIVSAVGHETDFTICDFVADLRAPTPSAAAELVCPDMNNLANELSILKSSLNNYINILVDDQMQYVSELAHSPMLLNYDAVIEAYKDNVDVLETRLADCLSYTIENKGFRLSALAGRLNALSPLAVLARGYSVAHKDERIIKSVSDIKENDEIQIDFQDGKAICRVNEVVKNG